MRDGCSFSLTQKIGQSMEMFNCSLIHNAEAKTQHPGAEPGVIQIVPRLLNKIACSMEIALVLKSALSVCLSGRNLSKKTLDGTSSVPARC